MSFLVVLFTVGLVLGLIGVASNPSPYYAALALVVVAWAGCGLLTSYGGSFLALVLFLIYLGGMLVVFAYSSALAAEIYPEAWLRAGPGAAMYLYTFAVVAATVVYVYYGGGGDLALDGVVDWFSPFAGDVEGVALMYEMGAGVLILSVWVLLLTLFVVLELVRGLARGTIRAV